jgi:DNA-directed RNA polymerase specialized sigma24 family protein
MIDRSGPATSCGGASFATTHWSVVLHAHESGEVLEQLCRDYWPPLYVFLRRRGYDEHAAKDLTQGFFASLLERNDFALIDRERGRFRTFLLVSLKHFLGNARDQERARKRGGGAPHLSLEALAAEDGCGFEPATNRTADQDFDRRWALSLLETVLQKLEAEFRAAGKHPLFEQLKDLLSGEKGEVPYTVLAERLGLTETALKVTVHRMRRRYRELLQEEIARTVAAPDQVEEELRHLIAALRT